MRKLIWYCSAAGVLGAGSFLSLAYYASSCPDSLVGRSMRVITDATVVMQPLGGLTSLAVRANRANAPALGTGDAIDEGIPDDPKPIPPEPAQESVGITLQVNPVKREIKEIDVAPIVIGEEDPMPREQVEEAERAPVVVAAMQRQEVPPKGSPVFMPYCRDEDDEPASPPKMPRADAAEESEHNAFKEWMNLFEENKADKSSSTVEELPFPKEDTPTTEPKCEEDRHLHEQYPGCPRTTCPYKSMKKKGGEESSEEPPQSELKPPHDKKAKDKEERPPTQGVDTMEYRKSDAGLGEYGPGQIH